MYGFLLVSASYSRSVLVGLIFFGKMTLGDGALRLVLVLWVVEGFIKAMGISGELRLNGSGNNLLGCK